MKHFNTFKKLLSLSVLLLAVCATALAQPLNGTYTIGGTSPNYATLTAAVTDLNTKGVSGPVTFNIRNGSYTDKAMINPVTGASATNRITFKSETNNAANVTITTSGTAYADNGVFILNSANFITIKNLTLINTNANYGTGVHFMGGASYDSVLNCAISSPVTTSSYSNPISGYYSGTGYYTGGNLVIKNNTLTGGSAAFYFYPGTSTPTINGLIVENNTCTNFGYQSMYLYSVIGAKIRNNTFTSSNSSVYYTMYTVYCNNGFELVNNTFTVNSSFYYGIMLQYITGTPTNPSTWALVRNNTFNLTTTNTSSNQGYIYGCDYLQFKNNTVNINLNSTSGTHYWYNYYCNNMAMDSNAINLTTTNASFYNYHYYASDFKFRNNNVNYTSTGSANLYPIYQGSTTGVAGGEYIGNKINVTSVSGTVYGFYQAITGQKIANNVINTATAGANYTFYSATPQNSNIVNNTFHSRATGSTNYSGYFASSAGNTRISNNIFSKTASTGYPLYLASSTNINCDYNNLYPGTGTNIAQRGSASYTATTLQGWRTNTGHDRNSISYDPGYTSTTDLTPDPANTSSWSLNGRGIQMADNPVDINNNARPVTTLAGVPDIGAYEFTPTATPPVAVATPATPAAGTTQVFTFGQDTVATLAWPAASTVPASITVRQYSGTAPPTINTLSTNRMFFYTDITVPAGTYNHTSAIYYKDPWMGSVAGEPALRLAKKDGSNPWVGYTLPNSTVNISRNIITTTGNNTFGFHTGIDAGDNASASEVTSPAKPFCAGTYMVTARIKNTGNNVLNNVTVNWSVDGTAQTPVSYTTPINTLGSGLGNEALVPLGNVTFANVPRIIKVWTSNPNSVVDAFNADDTVTTTLRSSLGGVYTIGGTSPNYATIAAAVSDLNAYGVCAPVTFNLRNGTYNTQTVLKPVSGMNAVNRVTFKSETNVPANVNITFSASSSANYTVKFDSGSYYTFKYLRVSATNTSYGRVFEFAGTASYDSIDNCVIQAPTTTSTGNTIGGVYCYNPFYGTDNTISNDSIKNGSFSVYLYGSSANRFPNWKFVNNTFFQNYYYGFYSYYTTGLKLWSNTTYRTGTTTTFYGMYNYYGNDGWEVRDHTSTLTTGSTTYCFYNLYCVGDKSDPSTINKFIGNTLNATPTAGSCYATYYMYGKDDSSMNNTYNLTNNGSATLYMYENYNFTEGYSANNTYNFTQPSSNTNYLYGAGTAYCTGRTFENNTINFTGTANASVYIYSMTSGTNNIYRNNTIDVSTGGSIYNYLMASNSGSLSTRNNISLVSTAGGTVYNYLYGNSGGAEVSANNITCQSGTGTIYGTYAYSNNGFRFLNNILKVGSGGTTYGWGNTTSGEINVDIYNNYFHSTGTGTTNYPGYFYATGANTIKVRNNIFAKDNTTGYCLYMNNNVNTNSDYNLFYTANGSNIASNGTVNATTMQQWRTGTNRDLNSLVFNPGNTSAANYAPNPANDSSWSRNGRGEHASFNTTDINGNTRVTVTDAGVPDIGPWEFTPSVQPPVSIPNIAPAAGSSTVYTFGQDTVAVVDWDATATIPASVDVRQWTGTVPPSLSGNYPYFYTDIATPTGTYAHATKLYYKDPWVGTLVGESGFRLMKKDGTNPWTAFSAPASTTNPIRNINSTTSLTNFGYHTVSDVANNASAAELVEPNGYFCAPATLPIKIKVLNTGNNVLNNVKIGWTANSVAQTTVTYTTPINTANSPQGNEAIVTMGNYTFTSSAPVNFVFYTFSPNGQNDPAKVDDTLKITIKPGLMGTYTIGGVTPDFATVDDAIADVNKFGVCGPVVFNIRDGAYTANTMLNSPVQGSSAVNRMTFQSENGVAANVTLTAAGAQAFSLNNISNVTLRNFSLIQNSTATTGSYVVRLDGSAAKDSIVGCILQGPVTTSSSSALAVIYSSGLSGDANVILKNQILNGSSAYYASQAGTNMVFDTNTIITTGYYTTYINYPYGIRFRGNTLTNTSMSSYYGMALMYAQPAGSNAPEIAYNTVNHSGYAGAYLYELNGTAANRAKAHHNTITNNSAPYFYNYFVYYGDYADYYNNTFTLAGTSASNYSYNYMGTYSSNCRVYNNKQTISMANGYGCYLYNMTNSKFWNNTVKIDVFGGTPYSLVSMEYCSNDSVFNNTFVVNSGANTLPGMIFSYASGMNVYNNVFAHKGGGPAISGTTGAGNFDYNNLYTTSTTQFGVGATTAATLQAWRTATGYERNSLSYDPGFVSATDLHPDPTNPASWSLNGRGIHINGNNVDFDNNARVTTMAAGVPDIGAYEFTPLTIPPSAAANPATPVAGQTQTFTFGQDTVATIKWASNSVVPNTIDVKQYTGTIAPAFPSGAGFPYYYVDIDAANITYNYSGSIYYKDPWRGTTGTEGNLRMLHQVSAPSWMAYNSPMSSSDANRNIVRRDTLSATGLFTMIDDGSLFSAIATAQGNPVFCPGGSVVLYANTGVGYSYQWYYNNAIIPGANGSSYTASQAGDYRVAITNASSITAHSNTINVVIVAAPSAVVTATGPLTYCTGGNLTLMANTGTGLSYQWKFNGTDIPGATNANYPVTQAGNYTVTVKNIGCSTTSSVQAIQSGPLNVNLGIDTSFCQSLTMPLILDAGYPGAKYEWNTSDTTQTIEVNHSGTYYVKVDAGPNCLDWDTINVSVAPLPTVNGISYVKSGNTFMFSPSGETNTKRYLWIYGGIAQDTNKNSSFTYTGTISMKVMLVVFNDCGSDTAEMELPLNVGAVSKGDINLSLYPNPASKDLTIEIDGGLSFTEVLILDGLGQVVYRGDGENHKQLTLDVSRYANGHYMIRATTSAGFTITKPFNIVR